MSHSNDLITNIATLLIEYEKQLSQHLLIYHGFLDSYANFLAFSLNTAKAANNKDTIKLVTPNFDKVSILLSDLSKFYNISK